MSIELTIDGKNVTGKPNQMILEVAKENGIHIPTLCYHPRLPYTGACRICVVDLGAPDRLEVACTTPISKNMKVQTGNERVIRARRLNLELLLSNLLVDVRECGKNGENVLLELAQELEVDPYRLVHVKRTKVLQPKPIDRANPVIIRDPNKCVLCERCVRACNDVRHHGVLNFEKRGLNIDIVSGLDQPLLDSGCASCGECVSVCPTGAVSALDRELVQGGIDNVVSSGVIFTVSQSTNIQRNKLGLAPLEQADIADLVKIARKTNLKCKLK